MSAKMGFTAGLAVGLLAGSRAGRGLYDRSAAAATAVVNDPRVRRGASTAVHKAGSAGSTVAGAAVRKMRQHGEAEGEAAESDGGDGAAAKARRKAEGRKGRRAGANRPGRKGMRAGRHGGGEQDEHRHGMGQGTAEHVRALGRADGFRALREGIAGMTHHAHHHHGEGMSGKKGMSAEGTGRMEGGGGAMNGYGQGGGQAQGHHAGMSAPSAQARPKDRTDRPREDGQGPGAG